MCSGNAKQVRNIAVEFSLRLRHLLLFVPRTVLPTVCNIEAPLL